MSIGGFLKKEKEYLNVLPRDQKRLLFSFFLFSFAAPMIGLFSNTYLWRQSEDPIVLVLFNLGFFFGLSIGFFFNGLMLKRHSPKLLYGFGASVQGIVPILLVLLGTQAAGFSLPLGIFLGIAGGFYWGNRNLLTSALTVGPKRFKFISLETTLSLTASILSPMIIGWFLSFGIIFQLYSERFAYAVTAVIALILLILSGGITARIKQSFPRVKKLFLSNPTSEWRQMRRLDFFNGFTHSIDASLTIIILLIFLGEEGTIGSIVSATAILAAVGMYLVGKRADHKDHFGILSVWVFLTSIGKIFFISLFSIVGVLVQQTFNGLTRSFRWASMAAVMYESIDIQNPKQGQQERYAFLMDREFYLNTGRVFGLILFIVFYINFPEPTIRFGFLLTSVSQVLMLLLVRLLIKKIVHKKTILPAIDQD